MKINELLLAVSVFLFLFNGALIDYWGSAQEHKKRLPKFLKDYHVIFWLGLHTLLLPFLLVLTASNFSLVKARVFLGVFLIGTAIWDLIYSYLDTGKLVSDQKGYFYLRGKDYGMSKNQIAVFNIARTIAGLAILVF